MEIFKTKNKAWIRPDLNLIIICVILFFTFFLHPSPAVFICFYRLNTSPLFYQSSYPNAKSGLNPNFATGFGIRRKIASFYRLKKVLTQAPLCSHFFSAIKFSTFASRFSNPIAKSGINVFLICLPLNSAIFGVSIIQLVR